MRIISITKTELIAKLEALLPEAELDDQRRLAELDKKKAAYLKEFRAACRTAAKMSYDDLERIYFNTDKLCPSQRPYLRFDDPLVGREIKRVLGYLRMDSRKRLRLSSDGAESNLFKLLTWTPK